MVLGSSLEERGRQCAAAAGNRSRKLTATLERWLGCSIVA